MAGVDADNVATRLDIDGYRHDFFELHGFRTPKPEEKAP
jgi:hypothetical protein